MTNKYYFFCFFTAKIQGSPPPAKPQSPAPPARFPEPQSPSPSPSPQPPETLQSAQVGTIKVDYSSVIVDVHPSYYIKCLFVRLSYFVCGCLCKAEDEEVFEEIRRLRLERGRLLQKIKALEQQQQSAMSALEDVRHCRQHKLTLKMFHEFM